MNADWDKFLDEAFRPVPGQEKTLLVLIPDNAPDGQEEEYARKWIRDVCKGFQTGK